MDGKKLRSLFWTFLKIGAFTFGGGYAMLPLIKREIAEEKRWLGEKELFDIIAIAESTPGPLAINAATFVGSRVAGMAGALCSTVGVVLPSFIIIAVLSNILLLVENMKLVQYAFNGIRAGVLVLIVSALASMYRHVKKDWFSYAVIITALILTVIFDVNTIIVLVICAMAGIARSILQKRGAGR